MLEHISDYFYDPLVFWGLPLVATWAGLGLRRALLWWAQRRHP